jgi:nitroreductase
MEVLRAIRERRSIRSFLNKDIPDDLMQVLADCLVRAPSAGNLQSRKFFFVRDPQLKSRLAAAALNQAFIAGAPVVIVCCTDARIKKHYGLRGEELYSIQDVSASIMGMMLVAHEMGLGTCWVGAFREDEVSEILGLGTDLRAVAMVPTGYPASFPAPTPRVPVKEAVIFR